MTTSGKAALAGAAVLGALTLLFHWPAGAPKRPRAWESRREEFRMNASKEQGTVVFFGDSITQWWEGLEAAFPGVRIANRGIAGDTTAGMKERLEEDVLALGPKAVVFLGGTNDLYFGTGPEYVAGNIAQILDAIEAKKPGTPVVLCLVMPREAVPGKYPERVMELNRRLREIAAKRTTVTVCDTFGPFADEKGNPKAGLFTDGLHLSPAGYKVWEAELRPVLERIGVAGKQE